MNAQTFRRGTMFYHRHYRDPVHGGPLRCVVTAIRGGVLYYRPDYGTHDDGTPWRGAPAYFPVEDAPRYASLIVSDR